MQFWPKESFHREKLHAPIGWFCLYSDIGFEVLDHLVGCNEIIKVCQITAHEINFKESDQNALLLEMSSRFLL